VTTKEEAEDNDCEIQMNVSAVNCWPVTYCLYILQLYCSWLASYGL